MTEEKQGGKHTVLDGLFILFASKTAMIGLIIVLFWIFVAVCAPLLTRYSPVEQDWKASNQGPSREHILGTDELGRDLWARLAYGARIVLAVLPVTENYGSLGVRPSGGWW